MPDEPTTDDRPAEVRACLAHFFEPMRAARQCPMSEQVTRSTVQVLTMPPAAVAGSLNEMRATQFAARLVQFRCAAFRRPFDGRAQLWLLLNADGPSTAVMLITYAAWRARVDGRGDVTLDWLMEDVFPGGFPSLDDLGRLWDAQKGRPHGLSADNLLDAAAVIGWLNGGLPPAVDGGGS